jgi:hypothetical protein
MPQLLAYARFHLERIGRAWNNFRLDSLAGRGGSGPTPQGDISIS